MDVLIKVGIALLAISFVFALGPKAFLVARRGGEDSSAMLEVGLDEQRRDA